MQVLECMYVRQALDLLQGLLPPVEELKDFREGHLSKLIVFSVMWSLGALLELDDRKKVCEEQCNFMGEKGVKR